MSLCSVEHVEPKGGNIWNHPLESNPNSTDLDALFLWPWYLVLYQLFFGRSKCDFKALIMNIVANMLVVSFNQFPICCSHGRRISWSFFFHTWATKQVAVHWENSASLHGKIKYLYATENAHAAYLSEGLTRLGTLGHRKPPNVHLFVLEIPTQPIRKDAKEGLSCWG